MIVIWQGIMAKYKIRKVARQNVVIHRRGIDVQMDELECGHLVRHHYPESTAEAIRQSSANYRRRCKLCAVVPHNKANQRERPSSQFTQD